MSDAKALVTCARGGVPHRLNSHEDSPNGIGGDCLNPVPSNANSGTGQPTCEPTKEQQKKAHSLLADDLCLDERLDERTFRLLCADIARALADEAATPIAELARLRAELDSLRAKEGAQAEKLKRLEAQK